jgi:hypothetical protein
MKKTTFRNLIPQIKETYGVAYHDVLYTHFTDKNYLSIQHLSNIIRFPLDNIILVHLDGMIVAEDEHGASRSFYFQKLENTLFQITE